MWRSSSPVPRLKDLWSRSIEYRDAYQDADEIETIVRLLELERAESLVDAGCGNGAFAIAAARANPRLQVWAFDALPSAVAECGPAATALGGRFAACVAWAESLPLPDACADRVLCRAVLHHVQDADRLYREVARVLRPDGLLVLQAPCNYWQAPWGAVIGELYRLADDSHPRHYHQPGHLGP